MTGESSIFVVTETGERTVVAFRNWQSTADMFRNLGEPAFVSDLWDELKRLVATRQCKVLALDMAPIEIISSAFIGVLIRLIADGLTVELLHPSAPVRESLEATRLTQLFVVRD